MKQDLVELYSPLAPDECRRRLREGARSWSWFDRNAVAAKSVPNGDVELWSAMSPYQFAGLRLRVSFQPMGHGSLIRGTFEYAHTTLLVFIGITSFILALVIVYFAFTIRRQMSLPALLALVLLQALLRTILGWRWRRSSHRHYIFEFLCRTVHGIPATDAPEPVAAHTAIKS